MRAIKISNARIFMVLNFAYAIKPCQLQIIIIRNDVSVKKINLTLLLMNATVSALCLPGLIFLRVCQDVPGKFQELASFSPVLDERIYSRTEPGSFEGNLNCQLLSPTVGALSTKAQSMQRKTKMWDGNVLHHFSDPALTGTF